MKWLVEIRVKDYRKDLANRGATVTYVEGTSDYVYNVSDALKKGMEVFETRCAYERNLRRRLESLGVVVTDCFAADAVNLN